MEASPALRAEKAAWLAQAKSLLNVPAEVVESKTKFTADPQAVYRYRTALANAILAAEAETRFGHLRRQDMPTRGCAT